MPCFYLNVPLFMRACITDSSEVFSLNFKELSSKMALRIRKAISPEDRADAKLAEDQSRKSAGVTRQGMPEMWSFDFACRGAAR
jgi:hypothetical protein